jgi:nucleotide-binding universal stress UspA family protein
MSSTSLRSVVVGVDASPNAQEALDWAAAEAARRGVPLHIAHAWSLAPHVPRADGVDVTKSMIRAAEELLARAESRVHERHHGLRVDTELLPEEAVPGLIRLGGHAEMLVVGSRGLGRLSSVLIGSVSQGLVAHAPCPVVVFRTDQAETGSAAVVLGAGPDEASAPVEFAFAEASRRGVPLLAVRTWQDPTGVYMPYMVMPPEDSGERDKQENRLLLEVLAAARRAHPEVELLPRVTVGDAASALVDASSGACLTVVGAERHRHRFAMPIGRVAQQVLHHAHSPVAVIPHGHS